MGTWVTLKKEVQCSITFLAKTWGSLLENLLLWLHAPPMDQEGRKKDVASLVPQFLQCSLMMLWCFRVLRYAKCRVATLLLALHKLQHLTGAVLPFFFLAGDAMWTAGDKLEYVQSVQLINCLHMFVGESSGVDIMKSEKPLRRMSSFSYPQRAYFPP